MELDVDAHIKNYWKKIDEAGAALFEKRFNEWEQNQYFQRGNRDKYKNKMPNRP